MSILDNEVDGEKYLQEKARPLIYVGDDKPHLLVEWPTGIKYCGQTGGIACCHPEVEGFDITLPSRFSVLEDLTCDEGCWGHALGTKTVDKLKAVWPKTRESHQWGAYWELELDESRMRNSMEAWIPVRVVRGTAKSLVGHCINELDVWLVGKQGWLLLPDNCD